eukprot:m.586518 g.586518  ORF g.586518 m.586518 type:complete len:235 (-) comp57978_c0_seq1:242-946(-)
MSQSVAAPLQLLHDAHRTIILRVSSTSIKSGRRFSSICLTCCAAFTNGNRRTPIRSLVGTPNYIAPEVFQRVVYGKECDWWSVGVIMFEMLIGYPPFSASSPSETRHKVINWAQHLVVPSHIRISAESRDLIVRFIRDAPSRIGTAGGADEIKAHSFFKHVAWSRQSAAPYKPVITHETDTSHFVLNSGPPARAAADTPTTAAADEEFSDFNWQRFWDGGRTASAPRAQPTKHS